MCLLFATLLSKSRQNANVGKFCAAKNAPAGTRRNLMAKGLLSCDYQVDELVNEKGLAVSDRG